MNTDNKKTGNKGEDIAARFLTDKGYKIITRNYRVVGVGRHKYEIDIIAAYGDEIVFVEVKTRKNGEFGTASLAVNKTKQKHIISAARFFMVENEDIYGELQPRFDVVEVFLVVRYDITEINHIESAFIT